MGKDWISSIPYFAGTSLKQLQIGINCPPETTDSPSIMYRVLEEMPHRHPLLESLELPHFYMGWLSVESVTSHLLQSFTRLKRVKLSTRLTEKTFPDLTHLRDLASLHVSLDIKALNPLAAHSPPTKLFPRLKNLEMTAQTLQTCITLLDYTKSLTINTLTATLTQPNVSVSEVQELCDRLQKQKELQTVHVSGPLRRIAVSNAKPVLPSTIYPLLLLPNITNVYLRLQLHVELDDGFIESIATSWPHLTKLHIVHMVPLPAKPRVTLAGLLPLSKFCLRLKELSLAVDICLPDAFDQRHAHMLRRQRSLCHPLTDMNIYWWIGDISGLERQDKDSWEVCAQFLVDLFPLVYRRFCWHTSLSTNPLGCRTFETLVIQNGICGQKGLENLARNYSR